MSAREGKSFLVFSGGNDRAVLGFLRALGLCGRRAHIVARTSGDRILRTRFRRDVDWVRPDHELSLEIFSECIRGVRAGAGCGPLAVLPSTEYFNTFLLRNRHAIEEMGCEIPLVKESLYAQLTEKRSAAGFFSSAGLAIPRESRLPMFGGPPLVAKPLRNVSAAGRSLYPQLLDTDARLEAFRRTHDPEEYFFQEYVSGDSLYLLLYLSRTGGHTFTWSQRNLLQQPEGKSMLLAEPSDFHGSETARRIVNALCDAGFRGLGMVEVIRSADREVFIEMNPRIWGPVQFCLDQHQPLLQAFIGDVLHGDPLRYTRCESKWKRGSYFWLGGLLESRGSGKQPMWHGRRHRLLPMIIRNLSRDVYLRKDSWRCFLHDLWPTPNVGPSQ